MTLETADLQGALQGREREVILRDTPYVGGVNNRIDPRYIGQQQSPELLNVDIEDPSRPKKRDGYTMVGAGTTGIRTPSARIAGLGYLDAGESARTLVIAVTANGGGGIYRIEEPSDTTGWVEALVTKKVGGAASGSFDVNTSDAVLFQANDLLYILPETGGRMHVMSPNGYLIDTGNETTSPPIGAVALAYLGNRVYALVGRDLYYSRLLPTEDHYTPDAEAWDRDVQKLSLSPERNTSGVALAPWRGTSLIAFFKTRIEEVVIDTSNPLNSSRNVLEPHFGCSSRRSLVVVGDEFYFLDQYGHYRALKQTAQGELTGVIPNPVSDAIRDEIPGNLNMDYKHHVQAVLVEDRIYLFYPRGTSTEANACMVLDLSEPRWMGPWVFDGSFGDIIISDICGDCDLYASSGASEAKVYHVFDGSYADDGAAINYQETTRIHDLGAPESNKRPRWFEMLLEGTPNAEVIAEMRCSDDATWQRVGSTTINVNANTGFPIWDAGTGRGTNITTFPITDPDDFPLHDATAERTRSKHHIRYQSESDLPIYPRDLSVRGRDLPLVAPGGGVDEGTGVQVRIRSSGVGEQLTRLGWRTALVVDNVNLDSEDI